MTNLLDIQSMLANGKIDDKVFEIIGNRFIEYKEGFGKSSNEMMDDATAQIVEYMFHAFQKMHIFNEMILDYINVTILKLSGMELEDREIQINKDLKIWIKTISDAIPHDKEDHIKHIEFINRIIGNFSTKAQDYLDKYNGEGEYADEEYDEEADEEPDEEPEIINNPKKEKVKQILGGFENAIRGKQDKGENSTNNSTSQESSDNEQRDKAMVS